MNLRILLRFGANEFLGEVSIKLQQSTMTGEPEWYHLNSYR